KPPQTPYGSRVVSAWAAHWARTGQAWQTALAAASRRPRDAPRSPSGWKNLALSWPRQEPRSCQSHTSAIGPGNRATFVIQRPPPNQTGRQAGGRDRVGTVASACGAGLVS